MIDFIFHPDVLGLGLFIAVCDKGIEFGITFIFWSLQRDISKMAVSPDKKRWH